VKLSTSVLQTTNKSKKAIGYIFMYSITAIYHYRSTAFWPPLTSQRSQSGWWYWPVLLLSLLHEIWHSKDGVDISGVAFSSQVRWMNNPFLQRRVEPRIVSGRLWQDPRQSQSLRPGLLRKIITSWRRYMACTDYIGGNARGDNNTSPNSSKPVNGTWEGT